MQTFSGMLKLGRARDRLLGLAIGLATISLEKNHGAHGNVSWLQVYRTQTQFISRLTIYAH